MALFEQPMLILFLGTVLVASAMVAWVQTQHRAAFWTIVFGVLGTVGLLGLERFVVTSAEQVETTLQMIARRLESNDVEGVLELVSPEAVALRQQIRTYLHRVKVNKISIKHNLEVTIGPRRGGTSAEARFNAVATLEGPANMGGKFTVPRFLVVRFRRESDGWRVKDYEVFDPRGEQTGRGGAL